MIFYPQLNDSLYDLFYKINNLISKNAVGFFFANLGDFA